MRKPTVEIIMTSIIGITIIVSVLLNPVFEIRFCFGIASFVAILFCLLFRKHDTALSLLIFALVLSSFNLVKFSSAFSTYVGVGQKNSGFSFGINPINLLLLLAVLISRKNEVRNLKEQWFAVDFEEIEKSRLNKIAIFKREFENYATERLVNKLAHENLVEEAKIAIQRILAERDMTMTNNPF